MSKTSLTMYNTITKSIKLRGYITLLALIFTISLQAQNITVKGVVVDETDTPLIGATVMVKGASTGAITDFDGNFTLTTSKGSIISFSYIGYKTQEIKYTGQSPMNVKMVPDNKTLDEVVVVGYGSMKRGDLTGSVASVASKDIEGYKSSSVMGALGGQIAGVQITQTDGTPGAGFNINIRGVGTLTGDASPLYIVYGFQVDNIDYLSNSDIESIEVLKDASSAAIYGARAANGVVMVSTKSGKVGRPVINYNGSASYRKISKMLDVLSPYEFVKLQGEIKTEYANSYYKSGNDDNGIPYLYQSAEDYIGMKGVDWQEETFNPTWSQDHNLSISGGSDNTKYTASFSRYIENGIFKNSGFDKTTGKIRFNQKITKNITFDTTVNYAQTNRKGVGTSADSGRFNMLAQILSARPTGGLKLTDEELLNSAIDPEMLETGESLAQVNPVMQTESVTNNKRGEMWSANASVTWQIIKGLTFKTAGTYNTTDSRTDIFYKTGSKEAYRNGEKPYGRTQMGRDVRWTNFNNLTWKQKVKKHNYDVMLGHEVSFKSSEYLLGEAMDFPFDNLGNDNLGIGATPSKVSSSYNDKMLLSFFARGNYNYDNRYLLTATIRADGSTVFSQKNKWGYFPSAAVAWDVAKENFMSKQNIVQQLKLRASFGVVGNQSIGAYTTLGMLAPTNYDGYGSDAIHTGYWTGNLATPDVTWESTYQYNIGLDASVLDGRLSFTAEWFRKDTKDLLLRKPAPQYNGGGSFWVNQGEVRNSGVEFTITATPLTDKDIFGWETSLNASYLKNKIIDLAGSDFIVGENYTSIGGGPIQIKKVGYPIGSFYLYEWANFNDQGANLYKHQSNGSLTTNPGADDLVTKGQAEPNWTFGWNNTFTWKNWTLNLFINAALGQDRLNVSRYAMGSMTGVYRFISLSDAYYKSWDKVANKADAVYASHKNSDNRNYPDSDFWLEDASFVRLKNISLTYNIPKKITKVADIQLSVSAQNLFTLTKYTGMDPEVYSESDYGFNGVDMGSYPVPRTFTFGMKLNF